MCWNNDVTYFISHIFYTGVYGLYIHRWARRFSPLSLFTNGWIPFISSLVTDRRQTSVCTMSTTVNGLREIALASVIFRFEFVRRISQFPNIYFHVSTFVSPCPCPCLHVHVLVHVHVHVSMSSCPCFHVSMFQSLMSISPCFRKSANGKRNGQETATSFFCCKRKNGNGKLPIVCCKR